MSTKKILCRYHQYGYCNQGDHCKFSHDLKVAEPSQVCRYFLKGKCPFTKHCIYDHTRPNRPEINETKHLASTLNSDEGCLDNCSTKNNATTTLPVIINDIAYYVNPPKIEEYNNKKDEKLKPLPIDELPNNVESEDIKSVNGLKLNINAKEFYPDSSSKSYSKALTKNIDQFRPENDRNESTPLCPEFLEKGECFLLNFERSYNNSQNGEPFNPDFKCAYVHGELCDICQRHALHPYNKALKQQHIDACCKEIQIEMEFAFALQRSEEKTCGICLEKVIASPSDNISPNKTSIDQSAHDYEKEDNCVRYEEKKPARDQRFGILPNCQHCYCLPCIMEWRNTKNQSSDNSNVRSCPECRTKSYFIIPSKIWVDDKAEKEKMIEDYKKSMSEKPCKYFRNGAGVCPLNDICFYRHAFPDGTLAPRNTWGSGGGGRRFRSPNGNSSGLATERLLWDFFAARFDSLEFLGGDFDFFTIDGSEDDEDDDDDFYDGRDYFNDSDDRFFLYDSSFDQAGNDGSGTSPYDSDNEAPSLDSSVGRGLAQLFLASPVNSVVTTNSPNSTNNGRNGNNARSARQNETTNWANNTNYGNQGSVSTPNNRPSSSQSPAARYNIHRCNTYNNNRTRQGNIRRGNRANLSTNFRPASSRYNNNNNTNNNDDNNFHSLTYNTYTNHNQHFPSLHSQYRGHTNNNNNNSNTNNNFNCNRRRGRNNGRHAARNNNGPNG